MPYNPLTSPPDFREDFLVGDWYSPTFKALETVLPARKKILLRIAGFESLLEPDQTTTYAALFLGHGDTKGKIRLLPYELLRSFTEGSATWETSGSSTWGSPGALAATDRKSSPLDPDGILPDESTHIVLDLTPAFDRWLSTPAENLGLILEVDSREPQGTIGNGDVASREDVTVGEKFFVYLIANRYTKTETLLGGEDVSRCALTLIPDDLLDKVFWDVTDDEPAFQFLDGYIQQILCQVSITLDLLKKAWYVRNAEELPRYTDLLSITGRTLPFGLFRRLVQDLWMAHTTPMGEYALEAVGSAYTYQPISLFRMDENGNYGFVLGESYLNDWDPIDGTMDPKDLAIVDSNGLITGFESAPDIFDDPLPSPDLEDPDLEDPDPDVYKYPSYLYNSYQISHGSHVELFGGSYLAINESDSGERTVDKETVSDIRDEINRILWQVGDMAPMIPIWHGERQPPGTLAFLQLGEKDYGLKRDPNDPTSIDVLSNAYAMNGFESCVLENAQYIADSFIALSGITPVSRSAKTPRGVGYLFWNSTDRTLAYRAPGDSQAGTESVIQIDVDNQSVTLASSDTDKTISLTINGTELPDTEKTRKGIAVEVIVPGVIGILDATKKTKITTPALSTAGFKGTKVQLSVWDRRLSDLIVRKIYYRLGTDSNVSSWNSTLTQIPNQGRFDLLAQYIQIEIVVTNLKQASDYEFGGIMLKSINIDPDAESVILTASTESIINFDPVPGDVVTIDPS